MKNIEIAFIDVDGTLFNDNHSLTKFNQEMCLKAQQQGIKIVINTGRIIANAITVAKQINADQFDSYVIANNGVHIYSFKEQRLIFDGSMEPILGKGVYLWGLNHGFKCQLYSDKGSFVNKSGSNSKYWADVMEAQYVVLKDENEITMPIARLILLNKEINNKTLANKIMAEFNNKFPQLEIKEYHHGVYEITLPNLNKGFGVKYLCELLKIDSDATMAFGDSYNDQWLLSAVAHPVAMENAVPIIKEISSYICPNNNENGVGITLQKIIEK